MANVTDPRPLTRAELAQFLPNQRAIRAFERLFELIPDELTLIESVDFAGGNYTTIGNQLIICKAVSTITLQSVGLKDGTTVDIKRTNGLVTVLANTLVDDYTPPLYLDEDGTSLTLAFSEPAGQWYII